MATAHTIPRFLLPQSGLLWRRANLGNRLRDSEVLIVRYTSSSTSSTSGSKPLVLEKPEKFNPPSHGARLPRKDRPYRQHYGGSLSSDEKLAQSTKDYPGMPPPPNTWAHWFWSTPLIHTFISMSALTGLTVYTYVENFKANSPFADMLPEASDYLWHPFVSLHATAEIWRLTTNYHTHATQQKRKHMADDVDKRAAYRKAHGLEIDSAGFFGSWGSKPDPEPVEEHVERPPENFVPRKREKFLGIF